jgi:acyl transferase domain-containing protein/acyl carrier protein
VSTKSAKQLVLLSAPGAQQLQEYARRLMKWVATRESTETAGGQSPDLPGLLSGLAYTLQVGREPMRERLALVVSSLAELHEQLGLFLERPSAAYRVLQGSANEEFVQEFLRDKSKGHAFIETAAAERDFDGLARLWVNGVNVDWNLLYGDGVRPARLSVPTLPFLKKEYWLEEPKRLARAEGHAVKPFLHPLIGSNISDFQQQKYSTTLSGTEYFLREHAIGEQKVLPAVATLEMALAGASLADHRTVTRLENVVWSRPIVVEREPVEVRLELVPSGDGVNYEIRRENPEGEAQLCCAGTLRFELIPDAGQKQAMDLSEIRARCTETVSREECYRFFDRAGVSYGPAFRPIQSLQFGQREALSRLELPEGIDIPFEKFVLHPSIMDGILQTALWTTGRPQDAQERRLPFALTSLDILHPLPRTGYVHATLSQTNQPQSALTKYDLALLDDDGRVILRIGEFTTREVGEAHALRREQSSSVEAVETQAYERAWERERTVNAATAGKLAGDVLVLSFDEDFTNALKREADDGASRILWLQPGPRFEQLRPDHWQFNPDSEQERRLLFQKLKQDGRAPTRLIWQGVERAGTLSAASTLAPPSLWLFHLFRAWALEKFREPLRLIFVHEQTGTLESLFFNALGGLAKTIANENPRFLCSVVEVQAASPSQLSTVELLARVALHELQAADEHEFELRYIGLERQVRRWHTVRKLGESAAQIRFRDGGIYLVTGGLGALGRIFVKSLGESWRARFILTGRSQSSSLIEQELAGLRKLGIDAAYLPADLSRRVEAVRLVERIRSEHGNLNGIIHLAGTMRDEFLLRKTAAEFEEVLAPKVAGTLELDSATADQPLDFFILFSSVSGAAGSPGQGDYAYANSFLDSFAAWREEQRRAGKRSGKTLSILWPMWAEGGMRVDEAMQEQLVALSGLRPLERAEGLKAFAAALSHTGDHLLIANGVSARVREFLEATTRVPLPAELRKRSSPPEGRPPAASATEKPMDAPRPDLAEQTEEYLKEILAGTFKMQPDEIEAGTAFEAYGIDSILIMDLTRQLEQHFGSLPKTLFFEYQDLKSLAAYFTDNYREKLESLLTSPGYATVAAQVEQDESQPSYISEQPATAQPQEAQTSTASQSTTNRLTSSTVAPSFRNTEAREREPIAIIGVSARFAQANDLYAFWENLRTGKNSITEIPRERWDWREYESATEMDAASTYSRWGSFLDDVDKFDSLFFGISPREAEIIDPQERLFLQTAWHTLEDAGYTRKDLKEQRVGVYVGVMYGLYQLYESEQGRLAASSYASIANRVSYTLGLRGPSIALDTMCSSALTAMHLACQALHNGETDLALAGGVNLHLHPYKYRMLGQGQFTSSDGLCRSFGEGGDGYVPGEGVGAVLLKPLSDALRDGDYIYGTILGSVLNHGGKTNSYTVPNPVSQGDLIEKAIEIAGIDGRTISYIEAHGTGTSLGDPIEIRGLTRAFEKYGFDKQSLPIGSVKSNIGHLESAAGIAGVVKVLLQMKHRKLVPSIHSATLNANIDWENSAFYVQQDYREWKRPVLHLDGREEVVPLRAGISSFGAGGANAHLILEEHEAPVEKPRLDGTARLLVFSAKTAERLRVLAEQFVQFLQKQPVTDLTRMAYTLQTGREELEERLAVVASSSGELVEKLYAFLNDSTQPEEVFRGSLRDEAAAAARAPKTGRKNTLDAREALENRDLLRLAEVWVKGAAVEWQLLYDAPFPRRLPLPGYPFEMTRSWLASASVTRRGGASALHPLIDRVDAAQTLDTGLSFSKVFRPSDAVIQDHRVGGVPVLPGVAVLEMARAAMKEAGKTEHVQLKKVRWLRPLIVSESEVRAWMTLRKTDEGVTFELLGQGEDGLTTHARGTVELSGANATRSTERLSVEDIRGRCNNRLNGEELYQEYAKAGLDYGPYFRGLQWIESNDEEALGRIILPEESAGGLEKYDLHPAIIDSALHVVAAFRAQSSAKTKMPYSVESVELLHSLPAQGYAYVQPHGRDHYHVTVLDDSGRVCVKLHDLALRPVPEAEDSLKEMLFAPHWVPAHELLDDAPPADSLWIVHDEDSESLARALAAEHGGNAAQLMDVARLTTDSGLSDSLALPGLIYFMGGFQPARERQGDMNALESSQQRGVLSLFRLVKLLLVRGGASRPVRLNVITHDVCSLEGGATLNPFAGSLHGFTMSLAREYPRWEVGLVDISLKDSRTEDAHEGLRALAQALAHKPRTSPGSVVALRGRTLYRRSLLPLEQPAPAGSGFRRKGVYLIIGGAGGLGLEVTDWLVRNYEARVVLLGRSPLDLERQRRVDEIDPTRQHLSYQQADAADPESLRRVVLKVRETHGALHGVIHSAIVLHDLSLQKMDESTFREALDAKTRICVSLFDAIRDEKPDFVLFFSSTVALSGSAGQSNYAAGCAFKDSFASFMADNLSTSAKVINWGYWGTVGVAANETYRQRLSQQGIFSISPQEGMQALERIMQHGDNQVVVMKARRDVLADGGVDFSGSLRWQPREQGTSLKRAREVTRTAPEMLPQATQFTEALQPERPPAAEVAPDASGSNTEDLRKAIEGYVKGAFHKVLQIPEAKLWPDETFENYGIDSLTVPQIIDIFSADLGSLSSTLLFEYTTIRQLTEFFLESHGATLRKLLRPESEPQVTAPRSESVALEDVAKHEPAKRPAIEVTAQAKAPEENRVQSSSPQARELSFVRRRIAIVGVAGRYPQANSLDEFWKNLRAGKDSVQQVPADRWDWRTYSEVDGAPISRWGGFLDGIDQFDPMFFNMSRREAEFTDPQERLFLETTWRTLEDAGYTRLRLRDARVGVYVGVMYGHYQLIETHDNLAGDMGYASIANRVSYFFDFRGPSMAVDTMCSSSLSAIHLACQALLLDEIDYAIAGGVNLAVHPRKYAQLAVGRFTSSDGRCRSFGEGGDGMVPGEGVGALLLKPLEQAERDGDRIYGVILSSSLNHGGKTSGYSVPNPVAQGALVEDAIRRAGVEAETIGYIEAHGTGTSLGDPIEMNGLIRAFRQRPLNGRKIPVGSLKSNIGHLESAAGVAAVTKVLLQMKHGQLVPSLHAERLNPNIDWQNSPFEVQQTLDEWKALPVVRDGKIQLIPRRAGISSFGAGGANSHLVLEEYKQDEAALPATQSDAPRLFILSAKNEEQLRRYASEFLDFLSEPGLADSSGADDADASAATEVSLESLTPLLAELIGVMPEEILPGEPLMEMGMDTTTILRLFSKIEELWDVELSPAMIRAELTLADILELLPGSGAANPETVTQMSSLPAHNLERMIYTLQVGREAMEERLAMPVTSIEELRDGLRRFVNGEEPANLHRGNSRGNSSVSLLVDGEDGREYVRNILATKGLGKLAQLWVNGVEFDWTLLYDGVRPIPVSLPTYPFARTRCWLEEPEEVAATRQTPQVMGEQLSERAESSRHTASRPDASGVARTVLYEREWQTANLGVAATGRSFAQPVLIVSPNPKRAEALQQIVLQETGAEPILLEQADAFRMVSPRHYQLRLAQAAESRRVLAELKQRQLLPHTILWFHEPEKEREEAPASLLEETFYAPFFLIRELLASQPDADIDFLFAYVGSDGIEDAYPAALEGFFRSLSQETARIRGRLARVPSSFLRGQAAELGQVVRLLKAELSAPREESTVSLEDAARRVPHWKRVQPETAAKTSAGLKNHGVYLITGGSGGLGLSFARAIAESVAAPRLILTSRSPLDEHKRAALEELRALGAEVLHLQSDVSAEEDVRGLIAEIRARYGRLDGIIHSAGVTRDSLLLNKTQDEADAVLAPKVSGTIYLDKHTAAEEMDFFVTFSSVSAVLGTPGQCDYAYANSFLDSFAAAREKLRREGRRAGKSLSINWPYWKAGGMSLDDESLRVVEARTGIVPLEPEDGWNAFKLGLTLNASQVLVLSGDVDKIARLLESNQHRGAEETVVAAHTGLPTSGQDVTAWVREQILAVMASITGYGVEELEPDKSFQSYGLDSVGLMKLGNRLNETFELDLMPSIFFEATTPEALTARLWDDHADALLKGRQATATRSEYAEASGSGAASSAATGRGSDNNGQPGQSESAKRSGSSTSASAGDTARKLNSFSAEPDPVVIVGIAGVLPGSEDLESFWAQMERGGDLITEIPPDRWDWRAFYGDPREQADKTQVKWGGFMPRVDLFDPLFFGISPNEADWLDPQQRLLLQTIWKAIEDAGINPGELAGTNTGLFVGVGPSDYAELIYRSGVKASIYSAVGLTPSMLANRISYQLDLHGPSEPIDTACSSSLVALHRAAEALEQGHCEMVIAGGINVILSPVPYVSLERAGMLSPDGTGRAFDSDANGYVRGEGVGAVVLKKLSRAKADGNPIYAVLRGTAVNHGGRASSLTAPNPIAQAEVIVRACEKAGVNPAAISYIETHGTGTVLGDPVEVNGLKKAFAELYRKWNLPAPAKPHCALAALKNVIGHLEPAAGIAGVLRVLLAMKHKRLTGTPNIRELNRYLALEGTPFYIPREGQEWKPLSDEQGNPLPRCAGVSSFGYGGVNAHAILEEYVPQPEPETRPESPVIFVLSAKQPERLYDYVREFLRPARAAEWMKNLTATAYTLQTGRGAMEERLALVVRDAEELREKLSRYLQGDTASVYRGRVTRGATPPVIAEGETDPEQIARSWVLGAAVDWNRLYSRTPRLCSLPTYPFAPERHWFSREQAQPRPEIRPETKPEAVYFQTVFEPAPVLEREGLSESLLIFGTQERFTELMRLSADAPASSLHLLVKPGSTFRELENSFEINPRRFDDYVRLLTVLRERGFPLTRIAHLWPLEKVSEFRGTPDEAAPELFLARGAASVFMLLKAIGEAKIGSVRRIQVASTEDAETGGVAFAEALGGFVGSLRTLAPDLNFSVIRFASPDAARLNGLLLAEMSARHVRGQEVIRYQSGIRFVQRLRPVSPDKTNPSGGSATKDGGVYLITGATGSLGLMLAGYLARRHRARLALLGRSAPDSATGARLEELRRLGAETVYFQGSVEDGTRLRSILAEVKAMWGGLDGVFHLAGTVSERLLQEKDLSEFRSQLRPKIEGTLALDEATRDEALDLFVLYSSTAAHLGDFGLMDYAVGNRFLDGFAVEREAKRRLGQRQGRTVSINWPLWREGGMHVADEQEDRYLRKTGFRYLESSEGEAALEWALKSGLSQVMVTVGDSERIRALIDVDTQTQRTATAPMTAPSVPVTAAPARVAAGRLDAGELSLRVIEELKRMLSEIVGLEANRLENDASFGEYGLDSFGLKTFSERLRERYGIEILTTLFFSANTIAKLSQHLVDEFPTQLQRVHAPHEERVAQAPDIAVQSQAAIASEPAATMAPAIHTSPGAQAATGSLNFSTDNEPVAVIGMSGRFPGSPNLTEFWKNLEQGRDLITEIPPERWNWKEIAEMFPGTPPWGAFLDGIDKFDPLFFKISPLEAKVMDPQHRLFLEETWKALEDAGCRADSLAGRNVSVFVGMQFNDYESLVVDTGQMNAYSGTGLARTMLANRISYLLDLHGESESIDTACSSSLVAIHRGIRSLRRGESELSIVGGVSLVLSPQTVISAHGLGILSPGGRCKTMDKTADGYVKGEGVAALVLKPLSRALADGDHIHAIIRGSAVNHGGRAHSLTAPNPVAQAELLVAAYEDARVPIESVSYLEMHGTGTELGDPIEIEGILQAYRKLRGNTSAANVCGLGTVKSNIGHLEPAAGVAGVVKVILAMNRRKLPASLHINELNPLIQLDDVPFEPVRATRDWQPFDKNGNPLPRRAGVSSFGFGGVNAHVVLEEPATQNALSRPDDEPRLFVLSAKNEERLREYVSSMVSFLNQSGFAPTSQGGNGSAPPLDMDALCYTLQVGRVPMDARLATVARNAQELRDKLERYLRGDSGIEEFHTGNAQSSTESRAWLDDAEGREYLRLILLKRNHNQLARAWVGGSEIEWNLLYPDALPGKMSLPTYPFAQGRFWIEKREEPREAKPERQARPEARLLSKTWQPAEGMSGSADALPAGTLLVLTNPQTEPLALRLFDGDSRVRPLIVSQNPVGERPSDSGLSLSHADAEDGVRLAKRILNQWPNLIGIVDLSDLSLEQRAHSEAKWGKITLYQELVKTFRNSSFFCLHFTCELVGFKAQRPNLSGANFAGLVRMLSAEYKSLYCRTVDVDAASVTAQTLRRIVGRELGMNDPVTEVCYRNEVRHVASMKELPAGDRRPEGDEPWHGQLRDKVFLISGGTRGIGLAVANELISKGANRLVLMGRQPVPHPEQWTTLLKSPETDPRLAARLEALMTLRQPGVELRFYTHSLDDRERLSEYLSTVRNELGPIAGVIHCAGLSLMNNPAFISKPVAEIQQVLEPKVEGLESLSAACAADDLEFFILCSSVSAQIPVLAVGISDYALANSFMDYFAEFQAARGRTFFRSIQWPSWQSMGMEEVKSRVYGDLGLLTLPTGQGLELLHRAMSSDGAINVMPCLVDPTKFDPKSLLLLPQVAVRSGENVETTELLQPPGATPPATIDKRAASEKGIRWLTELFSKQLQIEPELLDENTGFAEFGVDSVMIAQLVVRLEKELAITLEPSAFLENPSLSQLARYLQEDYPDALSRVIGPDEGSAPLADNKGPATPSSNIRLPDAPLAASRDASSNGHSAKGADATAAAATTTDSREPLTGADPRHIAVIGMACNFPGAPDKETFWRNLAAGRSSITEVPSSRWSPDKFYSPDYEQGKTVSKWGGFLDAIEDFDPVFFKIDKKLAPQVDPLMRQFLEVSAQSLRDAGMELREVAGRKVGVFVGSRTSNFGYYNQSLQKESISGLAQNFISAHVSHFLDVRGPSMVVDTACSSSLVSVHLACQSLRTNECEMALAGGVEILLDEIPFVGMSEGRALSPTGKCHTFDEKADGIVLGEGAGVLVLKRLEDALRDGDRIYAVIEADAINNDGRTMGMTTPNPEAQKEVIKDALRQSGIRPSDITYVETHGTGTMIGDPMELKALARVFQTETDRKGFCGVGSVKTNIGHLLSAAGIAGLIKVILSLEHKQLPPTLNCEAPNPRFKFDESPFYIVRQLSEWKVENGIRRAAISSFGFGGTNAHVIVSEGEPSLMSRHRVVRSPLPPIEFHRERYWFQKRDEHRVSAPQQGNGNSTPPPERPETVTPFLELQF